MTGRKEGRKEGGKVMNGRWSTKWHWTRGSDVNEGGDTLYTRDGDGDGDGQRGIVKTLYH